MATNQQQWGITPPVSTDLPNEHELKLQQELMDELKKQNNFESPEGTEKRRRVLEHFQKVAKEFIKKVAKDKNYPQSVQDNSGGLISTFGSYRLGVSGPSECIFATTLFLVEMLNDVTGSDIDTLLVAPKHVDREDFFQNFPSLLRKMSPEGSVEECVEVREAFVPIQKIVYEGIPVDLIFVALKQSSVPADIDLKDNNLLRGLDDTDLRSINGVRVTDEILSVVPQQKAFRIALRAIKLWANRRAIYSNISGFPGGVAWAMMVARVCQLYPMASSSVIVGKVLDLIARWNWPRPIQLKQYAKGPLEVREWNPQVRAYPLSSLSLTNGYVSCTLATAATLCPSSHLPTLQCALRTTLPHQPRKSSFASSKPAPTSTTTYTRAGRAGSLCFRSTRSSQMVTNTT
jgi:poly(A) polymerase